MVEVCSRGVQWCVVMAFRPRILHVDVWAAFEQCGLDQTHLTFIKELILGGPDEAPAYVPCTYALRMCPAHVPPFETGACVLFTGRGNGRAGRAKSSCSK